MQDSCLLKQLDPIYWSYDAHEHDFRHRLKSIHLHIYIYTISMLLLCYYLPLNQDDKKLILVRDVHRSH